MKKTVLAVVFSSLVAGLVSAQQEQMYTQFMFNKLAFNPAYAGSFESPTMTAVYRGQWLGLDGAPNAQVLSYHQPWLNQRVGLGGTLSRANVAITTSINLDLAYCYRVKVLNGVLGGGIQASMKHFYQNWADKRLVATSPIAGDASIPTEPRSKIAPNFGFGLYYSEDKYYFGFSVPKLVKNNIDFAETGTGALISREARHIFGMAGITFEPAEGVKITPQVLLKYVKNAPFDADINVSTEFQGRFIAGLTYRTGGGETSAGGESVDLLGGFQVSEKLMLALSYDVGLTKLRKFNNGSVEATVRFWFNPPPDGAQILDPRSGLGDN